MENRIKQELTVMEKALAVMKGVNSIVQTKISTEDKKKKIKLEYGLTEEEVDQLFTPGRFGGDGFATIDIQTLEFNIYRLKDTLKRGAF